MRKIIFNIIAKLPEYQSIPEISITYIFKQRTRLFLLYFGSLIFTNGKQRKKLRITKKMKNTKTGRSIILCASGPGGDKLLKDLISKDISLKDIDIAVVNSFYKSIFSDRISPKYYFVSDPYFWEDTPAADKSRKGIKHFLNNNPLCSLVVPFLNEPLGDSSQTFYINNLVYFKKSKRLSPIRGNLVPSSVVFHAISFLSYLGYRPIFVNGLDASFHTAISVNNANEMFIHSDKLYGEQKAKDLFDTKQVINLTNREIIPRSVSELLVSESIMLRDLNLYSNHGLVNIGDDITNDAIPRASLFWKNIV